MRGLLALTALATSVAFSANAATMRNFEVGGWMAGAYSDNSGAFSHCAGSASYRSGIFVVFSVNKNFRWSVGFAKPGWKYNVGETFDVAFTVDDMQPMRGQARAITENQVEIMLADSVELFKLFRLGKVLKVAGARTVFQFNLTGTNQLLASLLTCAQLKGKSPAPPAVAERNPFVSGGQSTPGKSINSDALKAEATTFAANLLSLAKISGFRLLGPTELPAIKGDARWMVPDAAVGTLKVFPEISKAAITGLAGVIISDDAKACPGKFASGSLPDDRAAGFGRVFTTCETDKGVLTAYYFTMPREAGGAYIVSTVSLGEAGPAKEADEGIRSAAYVLSPKQ